MACLGEDVAALLAALDESDEIAHFRRDVLPCYQEHGFLETITAIRHVGGGWLYAIELQGLEGAVFCDERGSVLDVPRAARMRLVPLLDVICVFLRVIRERQPPP